MAEVIDIQTRLPKPHVVSFCICFNCLHDWLVVQEVEYPLIGRQCPACLMYKGVLLEALQDRWTEQRVAIGKGDLNGAA